MTSITPFLWFDNNVPEAVAFYKSVFPNAKVETVNDFMATFELEGQKFNALNGGPQFRFNEAVSFFISVETQEEVDYFWSKLTADGGAIEYSRAALRKALRARVVDCVFEDWKSGRYKVISFFAKRARGLMARYAITHKVATPRKLEGFDLEGYAFDAQASQPDRYVFRRRSSE